MTFHQSIYLVGMKCSAVWCSIVMVMTQPRTRWKENLQREMISIRCDHRHVYGTCYTDCCLIQGDQDHDGQYQSLIGWSPTLHEKWKLAESKQECGPPSWLLDLAVVRWAAWVPVLISSKSWTVVLSCNPNKPIFSLCCFLLEYICWIYIEHLLCHASPRFFWARVSDWTWSSLFQLEWLKRELSESNSLCPLSTHSPGIADWLPHPADCMCTVNHTGALMLSHQAPWQVCHVPHPETAF